MNYLALQDAVLGTRFDTSQRAQAKQWIQAVYARIWALEDEWLFKRVGPVSITVTAGVELASGLPTDLDDVMAVYDNYGAELERLAPDDYDEMVLPDSLVSTRGTPAVYKVVNRLIYIGPPSDAAYTFKVVYTRRLSCFDVANAVKLGELTSDTDYPLWDSQHHYVLVLGATALGLKIENDPSFGGLDDEYGNALAAMREELVLETAGLQYGRVGAGY